MSDSNEPRPPTSAFESPTFGEDSSFHVDQPVGSMSISPCGRDVVLASKEGLHIIDLDSPYSPPRYLPHHTPWEVADVQWSPFAARDYWVASTSNQKALVWNLAMQTCQNSIEHVLHGHTRAITDINFSAHHPDTLATCAVDSFVHCWDLRTPSRPAFSFSDWFAGATQVKWSRQDPNVIASSHDKFLRIWDKRMGAYPIRSIEAHDTKIYGVDWNRVRRGALATCSLDKTIKFWDYTVEDDVPEKVIKTPFPVWRARNTPFGWGILAMPQRGNSDLHLYSRRAGDSEDPDGYQPPVHSFPGHKGQVKEFLWRARGGVVDGTDHREFQLVSWGTDKELRLHRVDSDVLRRVGHEKGKSYISNLNVTRKGAIYKSFRDENVGLEYADTDPLSPTFQPAVPPPSQEMGMNTISVPYPRAWVQGASVGMQGRSNIRADTNPISWMRGVKISGWDIETLGDEITHVGEKFTKVVFESVDIRRRKTTISLHGPWGVDGASLFLRVDIKFPPDYPRDSVPSFSVQKTSAVTEQLSNKIIAELQTISETYLSHKRGCLEGVVRYLLGESSLEDSIAWILGETAENIKSPTNGQVADEESSDEDEVGMSQSQELGMSSELLRPINANVMVPMAKVCGAVWAKDGRLVCFFPTKKDKSVYSLENLGLKEMTRLSRSDKVFEGFGRLQTSSPGPRITGTITSTDDGASEYSDDSEAETSSSSGSSGILSGLQHRFPTPQTWRSVGSLGMYRPRSTDNSQRSTVGGMTTKSADNPPNIISIHDFADLLPAKRELASSYRICGKVVDVCAHNAAVALDHGYHELARIWGLVKLILHDYKPPHSSISSIADKASHIQRKDSAVDLSYDALNQDQSSDEAGGGVIQWGNHPFGGHWLIPALFKHFEQIGDVQMVAMLSCVLYEPNLERIPLEKDIHHSRTVSKGGDSQSFSLEFYATPPTPGQSKSQIATPLTSTPKDSHATPATQSSGQSSSELWRTGTTPPYSTGTTPPFLSRASGLAAERKAGTQNASLAASPDLQSQPRSGSGFGSVLASSLSRSFTFGPSSASPPATGGPGIWTTTAFTGKPASAIPDYLTTSTVLTSQTHSDTESERPRISKGSGKVQATLKNQGAFDDETRTQNSFLDPKNDWLYRSYRISYARLLSNWGLPVQRSEMLKIGGAVFHPNHTYVSHWNPNGPEDSFSLSSLGGRRASIAAGIAVGKESQGLEIQRHCIGCGEALQLSVFAIQSVADAAAAAAKNHVKGNNITSMICPNCQPKRALPLKIPCVLCGEVVEGMLTPCLSCGHVCCFDCYRCWFSTTSMDTCAEENTLQHNPDEELEFGFCPSGCGCKCSDHSEGELPTPWSPSSPAPESESFTHKPQGKRSEGSSRSIDQVTNSVHPEDELEHWQTSPFASLARGLGGGLSKGLRGKEDKRKAKSSATTFVPKRSSMNQVLS
ncbi:hypothetical protein ARAM_003664 [Aspergillus rambellii]|uniref:WD repeat protein n=1 Tax=Aspergillus rambellii TaxID=308745 RepID=A0A0F8UFU8_9EURO|nr:hypothetical protein ARAM_003664 [Aspergillus rambellii]